MRRSLINGEKMISKKKLWLKFSLFFITLIIVPILIFESVSIFKNAGSVDRNSNIKRFFTDKLNTVLCKKSLKLSFKELLSATDRQKNEMSLWDIKLLSMIQIKLYWKKGKIRLRFL